MASYGRQRIPGPLNPSMGSGGGPGTVINNITIDTTPWTRPSDWLTMPSVSPGDEKIVLLFKVTNGHNQVGISNDYDFSVDWGDGAGFQNYSAGTANKDLAWSDYSSGTLTSGGFRQALVTIVPQNAGELHLPSWGEQSGTGSRLSNGCLEAILAGPNLNDAGSSYSYWDLKKFTFIGTTNATQWSFNTCPSIELIVGTSWTSNFTTCQNMFEYSPLLKTIPSFNLSNCTNFSSMFSDCLSLEYIPSIDTSAGTNFEAMFDNCPSLKYVPTLNTSNGSNFLYMFYGCPSLKSISLTKLTEQPISGINSVLQSFNVPNINFDIDFSNCKLSPDALNYIYNNLATVSGKTITVTGNWGATDHNPTIATAKGWTVIV